MKTLRIGDKGKNVKKWQNFLLGQGIDIGIADGDFGPKTFDGTVEFQQSQGLVADGVAGNKTFGAAMILGFSIVDDDIEGRMSPSWPPKPDFKPLSGTKARQRVFGKFEFIHNPIPGNRENIEVLDDWAKNNIITAKVPQLVGIKGSPNVAFHKLAAPQLEKLWQDWEDADLMHLVITWAGSYVPRFIRGSRTKLSNHAFGTAFDINVKWNGLGVQPALIGQKGSVRELVQIANANGFYWGGHFKNRPDGMHFEVAEIK